VSIKVKASREESLGDMIAPSKNGSAPQLGVKEEAGKCNRGSAVEFDDVYLCGGSSEVECLKSKGNRVREERYGKNNNKVGGARQPQL